MRVFATLALFTAYAAVALSTADIGSPIRDMTDTERLTDLNQRLNPARQDAEAAKAAADKAKQKLADAR